MLYIRFEFIGLYNTIKFETNCCELPTFIINIDSYYSLPSVYSAMIESCLDIVDASKQPQKFSLHTRKVILNTVAQAIENTRRFLDGESCRTSIENEIEYKR